jgi:hypothetical protein
MKEELATSTALRAYTASVFVTIGALAAAALMALCLPAVATDVSAGALYGAGGRADLLAYRSGRRLDDAARVLAQGSTNRAAQLLREAALDLRHLGQELPPWAARLFEDDSLRLESAAVVIEEAQLRSAIPLARWALPARLHLAGYRVLAAAVRTG